MDNNQITWNTQQGQEVVITIKNTHYVVAVAGNVYARPTDFSPVPAAQAAKAAQMGVVASLGPVAVTAERKALIEARRAELFPPAAPAFRIPEALLDLEYALETAHERVLRMPANPAPAYAAQANAQAALDAWKVANPDLYAQVVAYRQAQHDARKAERSDAVARALRGED